ncbi:MAG: GGDEF domain-containing protein [Gemmatimonadota bacterium]|nr:GGDEF domain-containing protein [Gemmatimonadota bacterium]MDH3368106.1 GGDEF domain-containing protein [Gemmatimonadota bacterium]MDH3479449.1 GGDEF domain-containing protein [Gemmatimonadota bacterium]MDH3568824.1 GGDEF domain-containing protein [Gemmatimonadota bacterium]MDH5551032.1 GGDEF domain-containing protein [Gemmatimonadota bacterium]
MLAIALMSIVGGLDFVTGFEISFAFLYLVPVAFAAWFLGQGWGIGISVLSAVAWFEAFRLSGGTVSSSVILFWNASTRLGFFMVVTVLLALLRRALDQARSLSRMDGLTGVTNGRTFRDLATTEIARARRYGRPFTVAYIDLDNFKTVNDHFGHSSGDSLLRTVAGVMRDAVRASDIVARMGGDEFTLLFPETDSDAARAGIEKLRTLLLAAMAERAWPVTFSIGVLTCQSSPTTADELIAAVDALMYEVKHNTKDSVAYSVQ